MIEKQQIKKSATMKAVKSNSFWSKSQKIIFTMNLLIIILSATAIIYGAISYVYSIWYNIEAPKMKPKPDILARYLDCIDKILKTTIRHYGMYWILENYVIGTTSQTTHCASFTTYCTHARDLSIFQNLPNITVNWNGPVSVALYTPSTDFDLALSSIQYVRNCLPESNDIKEFVTFHLIIPHKYLPPRVPHGDESPLSWPYDCNKRAPYIQLSYEKTMTFKLSLPYPINVLRNIARRASNTFFHLSADMNVIPKKDASLQFMEMIFSRLCELHKTEVGKEHAMCTPLHASEELMKTLKLLPKYVKNIETVYPVRIVELKSNVSTPETTTVLMKEIRSGNAKLVRTMHYFYGDPLVPYHDERIYWLANQFHDQPQAYALCLLDYQSKSLDQVLWSYPNQNERKYQEFTTDAQNLNKTLFQLEYDNIYGNSRSSTCQKCFLGLGACF